ncbi:MAG TPA: NUDIX domain-containing protein [Verrucomicrobiae bacterium]
MQPFELVKYCPRCGHPGGAPAIPFKCTSCQLTLFFNPTVSASAFVVLADGHLLLIRRAKNPGKGLLGTIGGFVDRGETAEEALRREIREEVHLEVDTIEYLTSSTNNYVYGGITYPVLDLFFICRAAPASQPQVGDGVDSLVSRKITDIQEDEMAFDSIKTALRALNKHPEKLRD